MTVVKNCDIQHFSKNHVNYKNIPHSAYYKLTIVTFFNFTTLITCFPTKSTRRVYHVPKMRFTGIICIPVLCTTYSIINVIGKKIMGGLNLSFPA